VSINIVLLSLFFFLLLLSLLTSPLIYSDCITRNSEIMNPLRASCKNLWPIKWKHNTYVYKEQYNAQKWGHNDHKQSGIRAHNPKVQMTKNRMQTIPNGYCVHCRKLHFYNENFLNEVCLKPINRATDDTWSIGRWNCWTSPAVILGSGPSGTHDHISACGKLVTG
jgi:hypothetical protein